MVRLGLRRRIMSGATGEVPSLDGQSPTTGACPRTPEPQLTAGLMGCTCGLFRNGRCPEGTDDRSICRMHRRTGPMRTMATLHPLLQTQGSRSLPYTRSCRSRMPSSRVSQNRLPRVAVRGLEWHTLPLIRLAVEAAPCAVPMQM